LAPLVQALSQAITPDLYAIVVMGALQVRGPPCREVV
jgi:hypothetical protein